ncbi:MAG: hypothetical protein H0V82_10550 [Candidatus Protochlamydia sp.]|nr:hypothetical protein [Candidatus Protochlamydia sp.]
MKLNTISKILFFAFFIFSCCHEIQAERQDSKSYPYNRYVPSCDWVCLEPYFLPLDHPIKGKLDAIFTKKRVTFSKESFEEAGFEKIKLRAPTNIVVGRHPALKGYLIKAYLDTQPYLIDWVNWMNRIAGAQSIQECIKRHDFHHFEVPRKWIYPLPENPSPENLCNRKNFILIVKEMPILSNEKTLKFYRNKICPAQLDELFILFTELGLIDSIYPDNIPVTKNGKIAFIDTEHHHQWPVKLEKFKHFLSPAMQEYWQVLIEKY